ncbi:MAG: aldehyde ferredoxin oxidoreductase N-terminal domain-containing protein [Dehalococcoidales bacterium]|nr:aldehyde ferredoxin oxidoreductase N-terminal domain-containing protein [Dehalococcoidales bacterium]
MFYGWAGANLEVDLSSGKLKKVAADPKVLESCLGGLGTNARILWDRVPPEVDAFSPGNLLIFGTGVLTGTPAPAFNKTVVSFKSPVTDMVAISTLGGFWGPALKSAGYDTLTVSGRSDKPVYLWINDDRVELRDACHLWGKNCPQTEKILRQELQADDIEILYIGPAGENEVFAASIEGTSAASASRGGAGAVMGNKKLKAIAVRGTKDINLADGARLIELSEQILHKTGPGGMASRDNVVGATTISLVNRNLWAVDFYGADVPAAVQEKVKDIPRTVAGFARKFRTRQVSCYNCPSKCK